MALELGPLRERNFRLLASARTISFAGTNLAPIAVAFAVLDLTGSATDVGIAFACWTLAQISTLLIAGTTLSLRPFITSVGTSILLVTVVFQSKRGTIGYRLRPLGCAPQPGPTMSRALIVVQIGS